MLNVGFENLHPCFGNSRQLIPFCIYRFWFYQPNSQIVSNHWYLESLYHQTKNIAKHFILTFTFNRLSKLERLHAAFLDTPGTSGEVGIEHVSPAAVFPTKVRSQISGEAVSALSFFALIIIQVNQ